MREQEERIHESVNILVTEMFGLDTFECLERKVRLSPRSRNLWLLFDWSSVFRRKRNVYLGRIFPAGVANEWDHLYVTSQTLPPLPKQCENLRAARRFKVGTNPTEPVAYPKTQSWAASERLWCVGGCAVLQILSTSCGWETRGYVQRPPAV